MPSKNKNPKKSNNNNNKNKNGNENAYVNANAPAGLKRTVKANGNRVIRLAPNIDTARYAKGLLDPFSEYAIGARVPDQFYAPTTTLAYREFISVSNSNTEGAWDAIFLPSLLNPVFSTRGRISGGSTLVNRDNTTISGGAKLNTDTQLYSKITTHRIVNWGIRIRNTSAVTAAQGVVTVALFNPYDGAIVPHAFKVGGQTGATSSSVNATMGQYLVSLGLPYDTVTNSGYLDIAGLIDLPCHMRISATELSESTYQVVPKLITPRALEFRASQDNQLGTDIVSQTSLTYVQPGSSSYIRCDGWTGIAVGYTGGSTTPGLNTFDIEVVYNLEGSPNVQLGTTFIGSSAKVICDPLGMLTAQSTLDMASAFSKVAIGSMAAYRKFAA